MIKVGYIGLGLMGKSMARNILKAGFPLTVHNRSREAVEELVDEGAQAAASPAEIASKVDVVITNLPDSPDVEQGFFDPKEGSNNSILYPQTIQLAFGLTVAHDHPLGWSSEDKGVLRAGTGKSCRPLEKTWGQKWFRIVHRTIRHEPHS